jgi:hypothetical protein
MRESTIVRDIMKKVRVAYPLAYVRKLADRFTRALPDILIVIPVRMLHCKRPGALFVETKTLKGRAAKLQELEAEQIKRAGGSHLFARDAATVLARLKEMEAVP